MKDTYQEQVREFHRVTGQPCPDRPTMPDAVTRVLRVRLMLEEVLEYAAASGVEVSAMGCDIADVSDLDVRAVPWMEPDLTRMAHEATDALYLTLGTLVTMGAPARECFDEVAQANLRKAPGGKAEIRDDGKVMKPAGWVPPNVGRVLETLPRDATPGGREGDGS
ncbi:hypothetical protein [Myxococcus virescens]|uniref:Phosphoribosyl-ATP pyrophosphohydrolase n=1 Tax=Myxococcus virescens TaxID=83456 RepID=A0A511HQ52_9BACT|nr:hypothetical protein [Myxococcus virescens]GEL74639.1 hypothetical protein MVI01_64230 [Myxococcus virescens]